MLRLGRDEQSSVKFASPYVEPERKKIIRILINSWQLVGSSQVQGDFVVEAQNKKVKLFGSFDDVEFGGANS